MQASRQQGMTLIEIMIVVGIIGILATIAYGSFFDQTHRAKRSDAIIALEEAAADQERYAAMEGEYVSEADPFAGKASIKSPEELYTITVNANKSGSTFTATATPVSGESQASDGECTTLTLTHTGVKGSTGNRSDPRDCWR